MRTTRISAIFLVSITTAIAVLPAAESPAADGGAETGDLVVNTEKREIRIRAVMANLGRYDVLGGAVEYLLCAASGKTYEALFVTDVGTQQLYDAILKLGVRPGQPAANFGDAAYRMPTGDTVRIMIEFLSDGKRLQMPAASVVVDTETGKPLPALEWPFTGSSPGIDPDTGDAVLQAILVNNLISLHHRDATVLFQNPLPGGRDTLRYKPDTARLPEAGTEITLIIAPTRTRGPLHRRRLIIEGRVQRVGYRAFAQRAARLLRVNGWVRNRSDGSVELVAEGDESSLASLVKSLNKGPRAAIVTKVDAVTGSTEETFSDFEIRPTVNMEDNQE